MSDLESKIESDCVKLAEMFGWIAWKGSSRHGGTDQIFMRNGYGFVVEFKTKTGRHKTHQQNEAKLQIEAGNPFYLVRSVTEFRDILCRENKRSKR